MSEFLAYLLIVLLDTFAVAGVVLATAKVARGPIVGAVCGLFVEAIRLFCGWGLTESGAQVPSELFGWLVNLRVFGIPILVGIGFISGSAAAQQARLKNVECAGCSAKLLLDPDVLSAHADLAHKAQLICPTCGVNLVVDADTFEAVLARKEQPLSGGPA